jgi:hypothetical protein
MKKIEQTFIDGNKTKFSLIYRKKKGEEEIC